MRITSEKQKARLVESGRILAEVLEEVLSLVSPGVPLSRLNELARKRLIEAGGVPVFEGYGASRKKRGFPGVICASLNDEVVHGIPAESKIVRDGDLVKIDIGVAYKGYITDMARTVVVGDADEQSRRLECCAREAFFEGVATIHPGSTLRTFALAAQKRVERDGFSSVRDLVGHGVGRQLHEDPQIPNYVDTRLPDFVWQEGMVVAIEPMVNAGTWRVRLDEDGWTIRTADGKRSSHYEDTILVTAHGTCVLTAIE